MHPINHASSARTRRRLAAGILSLALAGTAIPALADLGGTNLGGANAQPPAAAADSLPRDLSAEQRPIADLKPERTDLAITASVDRKDGVYRPGDKVELTVQTSKEAYVTVVDVGTSGKVHVVFPNQYQTDNRVRGGQAVKIPGGSDSFDLKVGGPAGTEVLKVIATTGPQPLFKPEQLSKAGAFMAYKGDAAAAVKDLTATLRENGAGTWAEFTKVIRIADGAAPAAAAPATAPAPATPSTAAVSTAVPSVAVQGTFAPSSVAVVPADAAPPAGFRLTVGTDRAVYRVGEAAVVTVTAEKDCRLTLLDIGTSGKVHILFPNRFQPDNQLKAGQTVRVSGEGTPVDFRVGGPEGAEALIGVCRADGQPVVGTPMNYEQHAFVPYGDAKALAKDLSASLRQPSALLGHAATSFLIAP
ncbi:DUF4384 domain-containing protein [Azospirillum agricola]|uniref:DUF4384 domain-containing protein n=1 Tax=Azospirillum agricola TaxID=1720247 RepID=UPI0015C4E29E|nr:DUF4384 domain-containing protein [Azospirillum agricola]